MKRLAWLLLLPFAAYLAAHWAHSDPIPINPPLANILGGTAGGYTLVSPDEVTLHLSGALAAPTRTLSSTGNATVTAKTANFNLAPGLDQPTDVYYDNGGAGGTVTATLPNSSGGWIAGQRWCFNDVASHTIIVKAPGSDVILFNGVATAAGGNITSASALAGACFYLTSQPGVTYVSSFIGTWTRN